MKKKVSVLSLLLILMISMMPGLAIKAQAEGENQKEFRVGMEAGYAPFNWTQNSDDHGAVPILFAISTS